MRNSSPLLICRRTTNNTFGDLLFAEPSRPGTIEAVRWASRVLLALFVSPLGQSPWKPVWWASRTRRLLLLRSSRLPSRRVWRSHPESRCGVNANASGSASHTSSFPSSGGPEPSRGVVPSAGGPTSNPCRATCPGASAPAVMPSPVSAALPQPPAESRTLARVSPPVVSPLRLRRRQRVTRHTGCALAIPSSPLPSAMRQRLPPSCL